MKRQNITLIIGFFLCTSGVWLLMSESLSEDLLGGGAAVEKIPDDKVRSKKRRKAEINSTSLVSPVNDDRLKSEAMKNWLMSNSILKFTYDRVIETFVKDLSLDADQEKSLRIYYKNRLEKIASIDRQILASEPSLAAELAAMMRGNVYQEYMKSLLHPEQYESFEKIQERDFQDRIEIFARRQFSELQKNLDLTEVQENEVYTILSDDSEKTINSQSDMDYVMHERMAFHGLIGGISERGGHLLYNNNDYEVLVEVARAKSEGDPKAFYKALRIRRDAEIERKVGLFVQVLDEDQLQLYRVYLEDENSSINKVLSNARFEQHSASSR